MVLVTVMVYELDQEITENAYALDTSESISTDDLDKAQTVALSVIVGAVAYAGWVHYSQSANAALLNDIDVKIKAGYGDGTLTAAEADEIGVAFESAQNSHYGEFDLSPYSKKLVAEIYKDGIASTVEENLLERYAIIANNPVERGFTDFLHERYTDFKEVAPKDVVAALEDIEGHLDDASDSINTFLTKLDSYKDQATETFSKLIDDIDAYIDQRIEEIKTS